MLPSSWSCVNPSRRAGEQMNWGDQEYLIANSGPGRRRGGGPFANHYGLLWAPDKVDWGDDG